MWENVRQNQSFKNFMTMDVRATGLKWFNSDGDDILETGTTIDVFQMVGITPISTDCLNSG